MSAVSSAERLMLQDVVFELNDMMRDETLLEGALPGEALGMRRVIALFHHQLNVFGIDQSNFSEPLLNPDDWFAGRVGSLASSESARQK